MYQCRVFVKACTTPAVTPLFQHFQDGEKEQNRKIFLHASVWFSVLHQGWVKIKIRIRDEHLGSHF
jgi:hypothetical protein